MHKGLRVVTVAALPLIAMTAITDASAENLSLRYSQWIPSAHFSQRDGLHAYFKAIEKATQGRVKIVPTAKGLGPPPRQMQLAIDGIADVAWGAHGYTPGVYPLAEMVTLPFVSSTTTANSVAYWRVYKKLFEKAGMHSKRVHTLGLHVHPPGHVYNNKRAIRTAADFKGLKLRATNRTISSAFRHFDAVPISPAGGVTALHQGLSKGVMDGTSFTDEALFNFRVSKFIKYGTHVKGGLYNTSFFLVMNARKWAQISTADQAAIMKLSGEALSRRIGGIWDAQETAATPKLKAQGIKLIDAPQQLVGKMEAAMAPVRAAWIKKAKAKGVDGEAALKLYADEGTRVK